MENINIKRIIIGIFLLVFSSCKEEKTEVFKLDIYTDGDRCDLEYFMVSNPPDDIESIINFYETEVRKMNSKKRTKRFKEHGCSNRTYFKERLFFGKNYKGENPDYGKIFTLSSIFASSHSTETAHTKDVFIYIKYKTYPEYSDSNVILPYLNITQKNIDYYPQGLINNPDIHWGRYDNSRGHLYYKKYNPKWLK